MCREGQIERVGQKKENERLACENTVEEEKMSLQAMKQMDERHTTCV